jgi:hypothetical protein
VVLKIFICIFSLPHRPDGKGRNLIGLIVVRNSAAVHFEEEKYFFPFELGRTNLSAGNANGLSREHFAR